MPDRADAAQRKLATIWAGPGTTANAADSVANVAQQGHDPEPLDGVPPDPNGPQRMLAAIWQPKPDDSDEQRPPKPDQSRQHLDERCARLSAELSERARTLGPQDPQTTEVQLELAVAQLVAGRTADAIPLLEQLIAAIDPADRSAGDKRAGATGVLAAAHLSARQPRLAIGLYESLLAGEPGASTRTQLLDYRIKLAVAHRAMGDVTATVDQLHALSIELEGDRSAQHQLLDAGVELATTNVVAGRPRDGVTLYRDALSLSSAVHGANHRTTLGIRMMLARAHQQAGQSDEAAAVYEQLVGDAERAFGADDRLTVQAGSELAVLLRVRA